jgi:hypothetical protein
MVYVGAYGILRWQDVLIYDGMKISKRSDGTLVCGFGVRDNPYGDDTGPWQELLGPPAERVFWPLCEIEDAIRWQWMFGVFGANES